MELDIAPSSSDDHICELCNENRRRYICPKCNIGYCSIECYKSVLHTECSEEFYKQCVEDELQMQQCDSHVKQKTLDILQRIYNEDAKDNILQEILQDEDNQDYDADLDSDDENLPSLEKRLTNINLDDADELWSCLTYTERQEFQALIQSGEASKLLPLWNPWWTYNAKKKLVTDLSELNQTQMYMNNCPKILDIPGLESVFKTSPFIRFSIINAVYAYAYSVLYFNGEHHLTPLVAVRVFLRFCKTMHLNKVFKTFSSAIHSVLVEIAECEALTRDQESITGIKEAGDAILNGPEEDNKCFYLLAALSDLHQLINEGKKEISANKSTCMDHEFRNKFHCSIDLESIELSKKDLSLLLKKVEFYIAWIKSQSQTYNIIQDEQEM